MDSRKEKEEFSNTFSIKRMASLYDIGQSLPQIQMISEIAKSNPIVHILVFSAISCHGEPFSKSYRPGI